MSITAYNKITVAFQCWNKPKNADDDQDSYPIGYQLDDIFSEVKDKLKQMFPAPEVETGIKDNYFITVNLSLDKCSDPKRIEKMIEEIIIRLGHNVTIEESPNAY